MANDDETFVRITNREIYDALQGLKGDVDSIKALVKDVPLYRRRVRRLELKVLWGMAGLTMALIALAGAVLKGLVAGG